ncbi:MAG: hypothetical protein GX493_01895 [Firmicutes bacterium]|nr:hypothetical protein [Bacillota bacterium]
MFAIFPGTRAKVQAKARNNIGPVVDRFMTTERIVEPEDQLRQRPPHGANEGIERQAQNGPRAVECS